MTPETGATLLPGDIVQVRPGGAWGASLAIVDKVTNWGVVAYAYVPGHWASAAYVRLEWERIELTGGRAPFMPEPFYDDVGPFAPRD